MMEQQKPLLRVSHLKQYFKPRRNFTVKAVDDISLSIPQGKTYGLVGESGSGKSTTGRSIIRLYDPTAGEIEFDGQRIDGKLSAAARSKLRTDMQMIFQDPVSCLNPRKKVMDIIAQGLDAHHLYTFQDRAGRKGLQDLGEGGHLPRDGYPLPQPVLGRPVPAHRHRPGVGAPAQAGHRR